MHEGGDQPGPNETLPGLSKVWDSTPYQADLAPEPPTDTAHVELGPEGADADDNDGASHL